MKYVGKCRGVEMSGAHLQAWVDAGGDIDEAFLEAAGLAWYWDDVVGRVWYKADTDGYVRVYATALPDESTGRSVWRVRCSK